MMERKRNDPPLYRSEETETIPPQNYTSSQPVLTVVIVRRLSSDRQEFGYVADTQTFPSFSWAYRLVAVLVVCPG